MGFPKNDSNALVLGGFKFSKMNNRKKGILVTSVDPKDTSKCVVVSAKEEFAMNGSNDSNSRDDIRSRILKRGGQQEGDETELEAKALLFCRLVNKLLRNQNSSHFVGYEVIYKMVASGLSKNRAEALALGKDLSKKMRLFYRVEFKRNTLSDDGKLYKFRPEVLLSVIMKSPMSIQKLTHERLQSKPTPTSDMSYSPIKFRKYAPKSDFQESKNEINVARNKLTGKPKKKGRRPKQKESIKVTDQIKMNMIPQDQDSTSEEDWKNPKPQKTHGQHSIMESILEWGESSQADDDHSIYTEVTASDHNNASSFYPVPNKPQYDDDEASFMELTVSTGGGDSKRDTHSYFDEYTLGDEDEYDTMSVPTTPVVCQKIKCSSKPNVSANDLFSPNDVTDFDKCIAPGSRRSAKSNKDSSLSNRMRRGQLDIEIPNLHEDDFLEDL